MKIAYLTADFGVPVYGTKGASVHVNSIASELSDLEHEVIVLTPSPGVIPNEKQKFNTIEIPLEGSWPDIIDSLKEEDLCQNNRLRKDLRNLMYNSWLQLRAKAILQEFKPDFLYERYSLFGTAGIYLSREHNIPLILEVNAPLVEEQQQQRGLSLTKVAKTTQKIIFNEADHIIVVSKWLKEYVIQHGAKSNRITVIPNGVDPAKFNPRSASQLRHKLGWEDKFVMGYVGAMKDWHGLPTVLEAMRLLKNLKKKFQLLLVGDGPHLPLLKQQIETMKLQDYVHLTGLVPHQEVPNWVGTMDVAIAPFSTNAAEYFSPVKLFEYMAMECPVIAARISQTAEIIKPGHTGWLYEPGNSIELAEKLSWMNENRTLIKQAGKRACEMVRKEYTWRRNAEQVIDITLKMIDENSQLSMKYTQTISRI